MEPEDTKLCDCKGIVGDAGMCDGACKRPYKAAATGPIDRAIRAAYGKCLDNMDGTLTVSLEWLHDYSRLLLQQACQARLRGLGVPVEGGSTRDAVENFLAPKSN